MDVVPASDRITELADACVKCGLCLPHCPTYALDRTETESPRGRIAVSRHLADGGLAPEAGALSHLDHCLGCMACERVCPVPVHYGELLDAYRAALPPAHRRPRQLLRLLTRPGWLRIGVSLARGIGARHWLPPLARLLPRHAALRAAVALLPALPATSRSTSRDAPRPANPRGRVALFGGCVQAVLERDAQDAATTLLAAAGFEVNRIEGPCCGALAAHSGDASDAASKAKRVAAAVADTGVAAVLSATPGCIGTLREDLPGIEVQDAMAFLDRHGEALAFKPLHARAVLHLPCTQVNVARADGAVRRLLARIPGLELAVLPTQGHCCGAAGSHMLEFPERASALRDRLLDAMPQPAPALLLTANIGCRLQLGVGLDERGEHMRIEHPLTLLARQLAS
ncbi:MAG TPA: (Fe-S)-binding protein [Rhodanobacteraceae bacterium]|nr:(Fe-S)-binding protein [Rhodanobacteraceae bacterium]